MPPRFEIAAKAFAQLGPKPMALYALYRLGLATGIFRRGERTDAPRIARLDSLRPLFSLPDQEAMRQLLQPQGMAVLLAQADEISNGRVRLFGADLVPLKLTFNEPLRHWTDYETGRAPIPEAGQLNGDIKFLWEPARFNWALTLGRAYHLSADQKYAESFWNCFEEFAMGNPAYLGPHWMNGQEVAIRLMSLLWAAQFFETSPASTRARREHLLQSIAEHARRIPETLLYARSQNNNHLVTESAALYAVGIALDQPGWQATGWRWLNHALQTQISSYGEYIQHSTNYHRVMLQTVIWVDAILRSRGRRWPPATLEALMRASHWLFSMIDPISGRTPNLGANDGALLFPLSSAAFDDYRPTVQAAARAFLRTSLPPGPWDELSLWLGLAASGRTADSDAYMAEHLRGRNSWGYLRASRFRSRLSHMDQLHFDLWRDGQNIAQDAGSYLYNAAPPWDNPLVVTRVHNTVVVDGHDQMHRGGRFLVLDWFPAYSKSVLEVDEHILGRMLAYHKGYRKLGVRHERIATVYEDEHWEVRDNLLFTKPGEHTFRLHWLLMDGEWGIRRQDSTTEIHLKTHGVSVTLKMIPDIHISSSEERITVVRAGKLVYGPGTAFPFEGWVSRTYGSKEPALSVAMEVTSFRSFSFLSEFRFE
jgi:hypothetical protein